MINHFKPARDVVVVVASPKPHLQFCEQMIQKNFFASSYYLAKLRQAAADNTQDDRDSSFFKKKFLHSMQLSDGLGWGGRAEEKQSNPPMSDDKANFCHHVIN